MLLAEALAAGVEIRSVFVEPAGQDLPAVRTARGAGVDVHDVLDGALARVLDMPTPQSVVAVAAADPVQADAVLEQARSARRPVMVLVEVQDPGNAGTLVRVAEAAGCAGVVLTERSVDLHNPKTVRATAGALFRLPVAEGADALRLVSAADGMGIPSWATVRDGGEVIDDVDLSGSGLLLVGSESHGLPAEVVAVATGRLSIPMEGSVESLNAAVAGALVAFEAARQRRAGAADRADRTRREPVRGGGVALGHDVSSPVGDGGGGSDGIEERSR